MTQILVNGLIASSGYFLVGVGFALIYMCCGFFHFAHGIVCAIAAYGLLLLAQTTGLPMAGAVLGALGIAMVAGVCIERGVYQPIRQRGAGSLCLLVASLGLMIAIEACLVLYFGAGTRTFRRSDSGSISFLSTRFTLPQACMVAADAAAWASTWWLLNRTRQGREIRAVASDPGLAVAFGLSLKRAWLATFVWASALAGVAGVLIGFDTDLNPGMGFRPLLMGVVAVVIGGLRSVTGIAIGAILLGVTEHLVAYWLSSAWKDAFVFGVLILFLLIRPQGLMGKPLRKAAV